MRLFVAVDIDAVARGRIEAASNELRRVMERARSRARVGWVAPDRLHLTLQFVGEVSEIAGAEVAARLGPPFDQLAFALRFGSVGMFPPTGRPRVVWLGLERGAGDLASLQAAVARRLEGVEFRRESRPFSPHLTLARFKDGGVAGRSRAHRQRASRVRGGSVPSTT